MRASVRRSLLASVLGLVVAAMLAQGVAALADITGPDVSGWQHPSGAAIDWSRVAGNGQSFTFIKATESTTYANPYFSADWSGSGSAGLMHGAYHFARPSTAAGSAVAQANYFVAKAGRQNTPGTLPPVLDLEDSGGLSPAQLVTWAQQWLAQVRSLTGRTPIVYSYPAFWTGNMANSTAFAGYPLWIAGYSSEPGQLGGWAHWTFWQYSDNSSIPGISGPGDMSKFAGTLTQLRALALIGTPAPPPAPVAGPWHQGNDFTGDGRSDIAVFRPSTRQWAFRGHATVSYGLPGDIPVPGDYNGNGIAEIALFRPATGQWWFWGNPVPVYYGQRGDIPVPGDYTGAGRTQIAVYRPSTNMWYVRGMSAFHWGEAGDVPVPGNYNGGNGGNDFTIFRPTTGQWWVPGQPAINYGQRGDIPLPARYASSHDTIPAIYRATAQAWAVRSMSTLVTGNAGDVPMPADMSGRGYADRVVFRSVTGNWYVNNVFVARYGQQGDVPLTGSNVPLVGTVPLALR